MLIDRWVQRLQQDRALQFLDRFVHIASPVGRPADTVGYIAVFRPQSRCLSHHLLGALQILAPVDPRIAQVIQHQRLIFLYRQRGGEI